MEKFEIDVTEHVQRRVKYTAEISQEEVVEGLNLSEEEAPQWRNFVQDYAEQEWDHGLRGRSTRGTSSDESEDLDTVESVTPL